ncbi:serine protease 53-like [Scomber japonicus]|uniref:serine protease 53-like n=1 Tax=Scomber japonicus TaxID=13676 RepID=UPI00230636D3|nr:serine protease 53-like [Scomber japonicus]
MMRGLHTFLLFLLLGCLGKNTLGSEIINGKKVPDNLMLYMASVQDNRGHHACGGFLISEDFVVTAAHCDSSNPTSVVLGTHNLKKINNDTMRYSVKKCKHPSYKNAKSGNDIMLLKLSRKAQLDNRVQPVQLPPPEMKMKDKAKCRVAGWGKTKTGRSDVLQVVEVPIINLKTCKTEWDQIRVKLPDNVICAGGYDTEKGFCQGDSGGPLVCSGKAVGVVSFNMNNNCDYPNVPNIYTDVSKNLQWIKTILKKKNYYRSNSSAGKMHGLHTFLLFHALTCLAHGSEIIDGEKAKKYMYMYMASVQNNAGHVCGGFLISEEFVVTAAHCDRPDLSFVLLGTHNLKDAKNKRRSIKKKYKHPSFKKVGLGNDIMLLQLAQKVQLDNSVQKIQLARSGEEIKDTVPCHVAGWGATKSKGSGVDELREVNVSIISLRLCKEKWPGLPANVICAGGYPTDKGFCQGDSGGPLVCNRMAVGVVSFNKNSNCTYPDVPNVYTDISKYLPWINDTVKGRRHYE